MSMTALHALKVGLPVTLVSIAHLTVIFARLILGGAADGDSGASLAVTANADRIADMSQYAPTADYRVQGDFLLAYDGSRRCPRWVLERIDRRTVQRSENHERPAFIEDAAIPESFAAKNRDYEMSGYDRGHMVCAEDMDYSASAFHATFVLSNTVPQQPNCNRGVWKMLEANVRRLALAEGVECVYILTCPVWIPSEPIQSRAAYLSYGRMKCIGKSQIWVPTHLAKAALLKHAGGGYEMQSWLIPNIEDCRPNPDAYKVQASEIEHRAGLDLWHGVPGESRLESQ